MSSSIRRNAKSEWYNFGNTYCVGCGETFENGSPILSGLYCSDCSPKKELELKAQKREVVQYNYHVACVKCGSTFKMDESTLFGKYCEKCGRIWERERNIRHTQDRLKKARNIPATKLDFPPNLPKKVVKKKIYRNSSMLAYM